MAIKVDAARPSTVTKACARSSFTQPTPRTFPRTLSILQSVVDAHIPNGSGALVGTPAADASYPVVDLSAFWLANVPATWRPA